MQQSQDFRQIVFRMAEASQPPKKRGLRFRETLDTTILGTLSTSIGILALIITLMGVMGIRREAWHDSLRDSAVPATRVAVASIVGEGLGLAGLAIGRMRGNTISPLSAVGTVVCLIQMSLFFGQFIFIHFV